LIETYAQLLRVFCSHLKMHLFRQWWP